MLHEEDDFFLIDGKAEVAVEEADGSLRLEEDGAAAAAEEEEDEEEEEEGDGGADGLGLWAAFTGRSSNSVGYDRMAGGRDVGTGGGTEDCRWLLGGAAAAAAAVEPDTGIELWR